MDPIKKSSLPLCLSIVTAAFHEGENVGEFVRCVTAACDPLDIGYEIILVDDGSRDHTWAEIERAARADPRIRGLRLSRNFGQQGALIAGMRLAAAPAVLTLDCDLQHPPELIPVFLRYWLGGADLVQSRRDSNDSAGVAKQILSSFFYRLFSFMTGVKLSDGFSDFRLMDRKVVVNLLTLANREPFLRGWLAWLEGHSVKEVRFKAHPRFAGRSKYSLKKMFRLAALGIWTFSHSPFRLIFVPSVVLIATAGTTIAHQAPAPPSLSALVALGFGAVLLGVGVTGEFLAKILQILRNWPTAIVDAAVNVAQAEFELPTPMATRQALCGEAVLRQDASAPQRSAS